MRKLLTILSIILTNFCFGQAVNMNGDTMKIYLIGTTDGIKVVNDSTIGVWDSGIAMKKINWKLGSNITYSNGVLNATAASQTAYSVVVLTGAKGYNKTAIFANVPTNYGDYLIIKNGIKILEPLAEYSTSGNVITIKIYCNPGDRIRLQRLK